MKTIYAVIAIFLFLFCNCAIAQYVTIPDSAFRSQLKLKYPGCFNGAGQMDTTYSAIVLEDTIQISASNFFGDINGDSIKSVEGLQYFKSILKLNIGNIPGLKRVPPFAKTIKTLLLAGCSLDSMPALPPFLKEFSCEYNKLTTLPTLPPTLTWFVCSGNNFTSLPALPPSLTFLLCNSNKLTMLPVLPDSLRTLNCSFNRNLATMPDFPLKLTTLDVSNSNVKCLPVLPVSLTSLKLDTSIIHCIPNKNPGMSIYHNISGLSSIVTNPRLCNATNNINGCTAYPVIAGYAFYDANSNGVKEANEFYKANNKIQLSNGNITFTNDSGYYEIGTTTLGSFTLTPFNNFFNVLPASKSFSFNSNDTTVFQNFAYRPTATPVDSMQVSITPMFSWIVKPGFNYGYWIDALNVGSGNFGATTIKVIYDNAKLVFDSSSNHSVVNSGNTITLSLTSFPIGARVPFRVYFTAKTNLTIGDSVKGVVTLSDGTNAVSDSVNAYVASSFDPNDKTATPKLSPSQVAAGKYIDYVIRYQNTGNASADHVVITDTLSSQLQANTLEMVSTSHSTKTTIIGNAVSFEMHNIKLPASSANEPKSHGFIRFRIKPKATLVLGDSVKNKAAIYFDYNSPVITNTAVTKIKNESTLPLKLISFKGNKNSDGNIHLYWSTANEMNTKTFVIEQSSNSREFAAIGNVKANGYGNNNYSFDVTNPVKVDLFFRLKMIDIDGVFSYSPIVLIKDKISNAGFVLVENPVKKEMVLASIATSLKNTEAILVNNLGVVVKRFIIRSAMHTVVVDDLTNGVYYLKTVVGSEKVVIGR